MSDRRITADSEKQDRRIIERVSDSRLHRDYQIIRNWLKVLIATSSMAAMALLANAVINHSQTAFSVFISIFVIFFAVLLSQYHGQIGVYLTSESKNSLESATEKELRVWVYMGFMSIICVIIYCALFIFN